MTNNSTEFQPQFDQQRPGHYLPAPYSSVTAPSHVPSDLTSLGIYIDQPRPAHEPIQEQTISEPYLYSDMSFNSSSGSDGYRSFHRSYLSAEDFNDAPLDLSMRTNPSTSQHRADYNNQIHRPIPVYPPSFYRGIPSNPTGQQALVDFYPQRVASSTPMSLQSPSRPISPSNPNFYHITGLPPIHPMQPYRPGSPLQILLTHEFIESGLLDHLQTCSIQVHHVTVSSEDNLGNYYFLVAHQRFPTEHPQLMTVVFNEDTARWETRPITDVYHCYQQLNNENIWVSTEIMYLAADNT